MIGPGGRREGSKIAGEECTRHKLGVMLLLGNDGQHSIQIIIKKKKSL